MATMTGYSSLRVIEIRRQAITGFDKAILVRNRRSSWLPQSAPEFAGNEDTLWP